jgi:hypothetical protein
MDWETNIPKNTIGIYPTMMPTEEPQKPEKTLKQKHTQTRTRLHLPLMMSERRSEGKESRNRQRDCAGTAAFCRQRESEERDERNGSPLVTVVSISKYLHDHYHFLHNIQLIHI